ncbi:hypothetical protein F4804DRAFT_335241 [Jackrogersella minutella]|nr:hypothetical protein F4804DRAFT_335241 [Jackrogersella minutella]
MNKPSVMLPTDEEVFSIGLLSHGTISPVNPDSGLSIIPDSWPLELFDTDLSHIDFASLFSTQTLPAEILPTDSSLGLEFLDEAQPATAGIDVPFNSCFEESSASNLQLPLDSSIISWCNVNSTVERHELGPIPKYSTRDITSRGPATEVDHQKCQPIKPKLVHTQLQRGIPQGSYQDLSQNLASAGTAQQRKAKQPAAVSHEFSTRKRSRSVSPQDLRHGCVPPEYFSTFQVFGYSKPPTTKRRRLSRTRRVSTSTCLRCKDQHLRCSGGFPCERCKALWHRAEKGMTNRTILWKYCFDSNVSDLDPFHYLAEQGRGNTSGLLTRRLVEMELCKSVEETMNIYYEIMSPSTGLVLKSIDLYWIVWAYGYLVQFPHELMEIGCLDIFHAVEYVALVSRACFLDMANQLSQIKGKQRHRVEFWQSMIMILYLLKNPVPVNGTFHMGFQSTMMDEYEHVKVNMPVPMPPDRKLSQGEMDLFKGLCYNLSQVKALEGCAKDRERWKHLIAYVEYWVRKLARDLQQYAMINIVPQEPDWTRPRDVK